MSDAKVLVIDDSATIRRLADSYLSPAGYRVVLAPTAEDGLRLAEEIQPDVILLDHQLPGTTGYELCRKLLENAVLAKIPVVISSTLRKRAYAEYTDLPNVVDCLAKPYTSELLTTTIGNALNTGALVIESQSQGTAVPEVMEQLGDASLTGIFSCFSIRELLDFLNNANKSGVLEVEGEHHRIFFQLGQGRVQGAWATGVPLAELADTLPESLQSLAPIMKLTAGGQSCTQVDGLVELLDRRVLDPRLLRKVLRHQAACLLVRCFLTPATSFRFDAGRAAPPLFQKLPLDVSTLALLIEGVLNSGSPVDSEDAKQLQYVRRAIRGQNLDRAGASPQHLKLFSVLSEPHTVEQLAEQMKMQTGEVQRVLFAFTLAELVQSEAAKQSRQVFALETDDAAAQALTELLSKSPLGYRGRVVRDRLALQLLLKRSRPEVLLCSVETEAARRWFQTLLESNGEAKVASKLVAVLPASEQGKDAAAWLSSLSQQPDAVLKQPYQEEKLLSVLDNSREAEQPAATAARKKTSSGETKAARTEAASSQDLQPVGGK